MLRKAILACAMSAMVVPAVSNAALIINGGVAGQIGDFGAPGNDGQVDNDVVIAEFGPGVVLDGFFDADISVDETSALRFEFVGKEAGYTNIFTATSSSGTGTISNRDPKGTSFDLFDVLAGIIDFRFDVVNTSKSVSNGANNDNTIKFLADFWVGWDPNDAGALLVALDDGGANPDDDNHDDMVIRISQVSEPGMLGLVGLGLVGFGMSRRKKA